MFIFWFIAALHNAQTLSTHSHRAQTVTKSLKKNDKLKNVPTSKKSLWTNFCNSIQAHKHTYTPTPTHIQTLSLSLSLFLSLIHTYTHTRTYGADVCMYLRVGGWKVVSGIVKGAYGYN